MDQIYLEEVPKSQMGQIAHSTRLCWTKFLYSFHMYTLFFPLNVFLFSPLSLIFSFFLLIDLLLLAILCLTSIFLFSLTMLSIHFVSNFMVLGTAEVAVSIYCIVHPCMMNYKITVFSFKIIIHISWPVLLVGSPSLNFTFLLSTSFPYL